MVFLHASATFKFNNWARLINKRRVHYVLATHWDREVSEIFSEMRYLLVVLDWVIVGLEEGR